MTTTADLRAAVQAAVERLMPAHRADIWDVEWEPLTIPEPCERCGTRVVLILWQERRGWYEMTSKNLHARLYMGKNGMERTQFLPHTGERCAAARTALSEPTQLDLLTGEPA